MRLDRYLSAILLFAGGLLAADVGLWVAGSASSGPQPMPAQRSRPGRPVAPVPQPVPDALPGSSALTSTLYFPFTARQALSITTPTSTTTATPSSTPTSTTTATPSSTPTAEPPPPWPLTRASVASDGTQANGGSGSATISGDGRLVAFASSARNLVAGDSNGAQDIFVYDRETKLTARVSVATGGAQANGGSSAPAISGDGRFVAFQSSASNLVTGDTNTVSDIFVHDRQTGQTTRVSVASDGTQATQGQSLDPAISKDGRFVAFESDAFDLVTGDTNYSCGEILTCPDIFVHDRQTGQTTRVSVASDGTQANGGSESATISGDGRLVAFASINTSLVAGDSSYNWDIFVHDRETKLTARVSVATGGAEANGESSAPAISEDGSFVAFESSASNLVTGDTNTVSEIFVHDRQTGQTTRVSVASNGTPADQNSFSPVLSGDGRLVAFSSYASNLVPGDENWHQVIFVHDRSTGQTTRISLAAGDLQANGSSVYPALSADGSAVAFESQANNLVPGDTNNQWDVFLVGRAAR